MEQSNLDLKQSRSIRIKTFSGNKNKQSKEFQENKENYSMEKNQFNKRKNLTIINNNNNNINPNSTHNHSKSVAGRKSLRLGLTLMNGLKSISSTNSPLRQPNLINNDTNSPLQSKQLNSPLKQKNSTQINNKTTVKKKLTLNPHNNHNISNNSSKSNNNYYNNKDKEQQKELDYIEQIKLKLIKLAKQNQINSKIKEQRETQVVIEKRDRRRSSRPSIFFPNLQEIQQYRPQRVNSVQSSQISEEYRTSNLNSYESGESPKNQKLKITQPLGKLNVRLSNVPTGTLLKSTWSFDEKQPEIESDSDSIKIYKKYKKKMLGKVCGKQLIFQSQFSIFIWPSMKPNTSNAESQTNQAKQDKYFLEYMKLRLIKKGYFEEIEQKYKQLKQLVDQTQKFTENHKQLIQYIESGPENQRQQRVFALSSNIKQKQIQIKKAFEQLRQRQQTTQRFFNKKIDQAKSRSQNLHSSLKNHFKMLLKISEKKYQNSIQNDKFCRILTKMLIQIKNLAQNNNQLTKLCSKVFLDSQVQRDKFYGKYKQWAQLQVQNRMLIYNFMKQIEQIPQITNKLFGCQQNQLFAGYKEQLTLEERASRYMSIKCEQCYDFKQKVKYIQFKNHQIRPILKSLQWLLRDVGKKQTLISLL